jgi:2,3,4,5-tetrahydropyridine-2-carboxylate N-succinyltransferase
MSERASEQAHGWGLATVVTDGPGTDTVLDTWFPAPALGGAPAGTEPPEGLEGLAREHGVRRVHTEVRHVRIDLTAPPSDAPDAYLRLHLLSHRLVRPHGLNVDGIFGVLPNVVWTSAGACAVDGFESTRLRMRAQGPVQVYGVDKFPRMTDYVVPPGVRIADADRVRLGAHLAAGTPVRHEGFVNYNAGIGISLGDDCVVEAGCYVTAGTKVTMPDGKVVKALDLSGGDHLLFRRNSVTGTVEVVPWRAGGVALNEALHRN